MAYTATHSKKIRTELSTIKQDVALLRSMLISLLGKDREGNYRSSFIKQILKSAREKPTRSFSDPKDFLSQLS